MIIQEKNKITEITHNYFWAIKFNNNFVPYKNLSIIAKNIFVDVMIKFCDVFLKLTLKWNTFELF